VPGSARPSASVRQFHTSTLAVNMPEHEPHVWAGVLLLGLDVASGTLSSRQRAMMRSMWSRGGGFTCLAMLDLNDRPPSETRARHDKTGMFYRISAPSAGLGVILSQFEMQTNASAHGRLACIRRCRDSCAGWRGISMPSWPWRVHRPTAMVLNSLRRLPAASSCGQPLAEILEVDVHHGHDW